MERFMFRKIELWVVALILVAAALVAIAFGTVVKNVTEARQDPTRPAPFGAVGAAAYRLAATPGTIKQLLTETEPLIAGNFQRFGQRSGWTRHGDISNEPGYLLLSRHDADHAEAVIELVRLSDLTTQYRWVAAPDILFGGASQSLGNTDYTQWRKSRFRVMHPLLEPDGSIVLHGQQSPLVRMGACGERLMIDDTIHAHHSLNLDAEGQFWAPVVMEAVHGSHARNYEDDALARFAPDGRLTFLRSVPDLLERHGLTYLVFPAYDLQRSVVHLNDIEPALVDGPYWKKGDLFVSLRRQSMVFLYRPSTDAIVWMKQGPWVDQHDVDILDDHRIAVFNNNAVDRGNGVEVDGNSNIMVYDFRTGLVQRQFDGAMADAAVEAVSNGLFDMIPNGDVLVEEDTSGRVLLIGEDQEILAEFINRAANGKVYRMGWSRYIPQELGDRALASLSARSCPHD